MSEHLASLVIDALAGGHLPAAEAAEARLHVERCARCRDDLDTATAACAHFSQVVLPRTVGTLRPRTPWWRAFGPAVIVPALAVAVLLIWLVQGPDAPTNEPALQIKGERTFQMFANHGGKIVPVRDATRLGPADQIRFIVGSRDLRFLLVASVDGAGKATVYYPFGGERSGPVSKEPSELPGSIVLDAAPGPERVFALFSREPLDAVIVTSALTAIGKAGDDAIRATHTLDVPADAQTSVVFEKVIP